jgi:hypothetical protein
VSYPQLNAMTVELVNALVSGKPLQVEPEIVADVRKNLKTWADAKDEFWPFVQSVEVDIYAGVLNKNLADGLGNILSRFEDRWKRNSNRREWSSVRDQARFLFRPYHAKATQVERKAMSDLQRLLDSYA